MDAPPGDALHVNFLGTRVAAGTFRKLILLPRLPRCTQGKYMRFTLAMMQDVQGCPHLTALGWTNDALGRNLDYGRLLMKFCLQDFEMEFLLLRLKIALRRNQPIVSHCQFDSTPLRSYDVKDRGVTAKESLLVRRSVLWAASEQSQGALSRVAGECSGDDLQRCLERHWTTSDLADERRTHIAGVVAGDLFARCRSVWDLINDSGGAEWRTWTLSHWVADRGALAPLKMTKDFGTESVQCHATAARPVSTKGAFDLEVRDCCSDHCLHSVVESALKLTEKRQKDLKRVAFGLRNSMWVMRDFIGDYMQTHMFARDQKMDAEEKSQYLQLLRLILGKRLLEKGGQRLYELLDQYEVRGRISGGFCSRATTEAGADDVEEAIGLALSCVKLLNFSRAGRVTQNTAGVVLLDVMGVTGLPSFVMRNSGRKYFLGLALDPAENWSDYVSFCWVATLALEPVSTVQDGLLASCTVADLVSAQASLHHRTLALHERNFAALLTVCARFRRMPSAVQGMAAAIHDAADAVAGEAQVLLFDRVLQRPPWSHFATALGRGDRDGKSFQQCVLESVLSCDEEHADGGFTAKVQNVARDSYFLKSTGLQQSLWDLFRLMMVLPISTLIVEQAHVLAAGYAGRVGHDTINECQFLAQVVRSNGAAESSRQETLGEQIDPAALRTDERIRVDSGAHQVRRENILLRHAAETTTLNLAVQEDFEMLPARILTGRETISLTAMEVDAERDVLIAEKIARERQVEQKRAQEIRAAQDRAVKRATTCCGTNSDNFLLSLSDRQVADFARDFQTAESLTRRKQVAQAAWSSDEVEAFERKYDEAPREQLPRFDLAPFLDRGVVHLCQYAAKHGKDAVVGGVVGFSNRSDADSGAMEWGLFRIVSVALGPYLVVGQELEVETQDLEHSAEDGSETQRLLKTARYMELTHLASGFFVRPSLVEFVSGTGSVLTLPFDPTYPSMLLRRGKEVLVLGVDDSKKEIKPLSRSGGEVGGRVEKRWRPHVKSSRVLEQPVVDRPQLSEVERKEVKTDLQNIREHAWAAHQSSSYCPKLVRPFSIAVRGGLWTMREKGVAADATRFEAKGKRLKKWCKSLELPLRKDAAHSAFGDHDESYRFLHVIGHAYRFFLENGATILNPGAEAGAGDRAWTAECQEEYDSAVQPRIAAVQEKHSAVLKVQKRNEIFTVLARVRSEAVFSLGVVGANADLIPENSEAEDDLLAEEP
eukprot:g12168.t1